MLIPRKRHRHCNELQYQLSRDFRVWQPKHCSKRKRKQIKLQNAITGMEAWHGSQEI
jgi:hypothetical protein